MTRAAGREAPGADAFGDPTQRPVVQLSSHPSPHPLLRKHMLGHVPRGLGPGTLVTLKTPDGGVLGDGFYNDHSELIVRRLTTGDVRFDRAALAGAVDRAVSLRESLPDVVEAAECWRVIHAEGDSLSGLIVDRYGDVVVIELHSAGWVPLIDDLVAVLHERLGTVHHQVTLDERISNLERVTKVRRYSEGCPRSVVVREHGVRYRVDLELAHKTGFFCDQRDNRLRFARWARGDVLDVCCHAGGFSLCAAENGQTDSLTAVDLDEKALERARENANLNQRRVHQVHADAFDWMRQVGGAGRSFDTVVVDPPKFAPTRRDLDKAEGKYHDLNRLALKLVAPGGRLLTCSCSGLMSREKLVELVRTAARKSGRSVRILAVTGAAPDHPVLLECPETEYLKALWLAVE